MFIKLPETFGSSERWLNVGHIESCSTAQIMGLEGVLGALVEVVMTSGRTYSTSGMSIEVAHGIVEEILQLTAVASGCGDPSCAC